MQHRPRKQFGQNFLTDVHVIESIVQAIHPQSTDKMIEIGPGLGALTLPLLKTLDSLTAIEIDSDLVTYFQNKSLPSLTIIPQDVLTVDFSRLGTNLRIVGNLPYNISTPLLIHLLRFKSSITDMHFMLQKEVVDRIVAKPNCKAYGRLSIMIQYHCEAEALFDVPPESFQPQPKVDSAILRLTPYQNSPYGEVCIETLQQIVAQAFGMRRKTLANNLKPILSAEQLYQLNIDPKNRPEQLFIEEYVRIAQFVKNNRNL